MKDNKNILVSIIVPIYNVEKYLRKCVDSLISQIHNNIEIILVDDGSTDASPNICDEYTRMDERIKVIHKKNEGVSIARNEGIKTSKGEWITFVDADDYVECDYIDYLLKNALDYECDISLTCFPRKICEGKESKKLEIKNDSIHILSGVEAAEMMLYYKIVISSWNKMFKKELLTNENIMFNSKLSYGEGFEFVTKCMMKSKKVAIGTKKIYNYRVDNQNSVMTHFKEKLVTGSIDAQKEIKSNIQEMINSKEIVKRLLKAWDYSNWHTHCDCLNTLYGCKVNSQYKQLTKKISKVCKIDAKSVWNKNVPRIDKIKGVLYFLSPMIAANTINTLRMRKFNSN